MVPCIGPYGHKHQGANPQNIPRAATAAKLHRLDAVDMTMVSTPTSSNQSRQSHLVDGQDDARAQPKCYGPAQVSPRASSPQSSSPDCSSEQQPGPGRAVKTQGRNGPIRR